MGKWYAKDTGGDVGAVCQVRITLSNAAWTLAVAGSMMTGNGTPATSAPDRVVAAYFWHSRRAAATFMGPRLAGMKTVAREPEPHYAIDLVHKVKGFKGQPSPGRIEVRTALIITAAVRTAQLEPARERVRAHLAGRPDELGLLGFEAFFAAGDAATAGAAPAQLAPLAGAPVPPAPLTRPASTAPPAPMAMAPPPRASTAPLVEVAPHCSATPRERLSGGASVIAPPASTPQPAHQRLATPPATPSPDALPISDATAARLSSRRAPSLEAAAFSGAPTAPPDAYAVAPRTASSARAAGADAFPRAASPSSPSASVALRVAAADSALLEASIFEEMLRRDLAAEGGAEEKAEHRAERHCRIAAGAWHLARCSGTEAALDAELKADYGSADLCLDWAARVVYDQCGGREIEHDRYWNGGGRERNHDRYWNGGGRSRRLDRHWNGGGRSRQLDLYWNGGGRLRQLDRYRNGGGRERAHEYQQELYHERGGRQRHFALEFGSVENRERVHLQRQLDGLVALLSSEAPRCAPLFDGDVDARVVVAVAGIYLGASEESVATDPWAALEGALEGLGIVTTPPERGHGGHDVKKVWLLRCARVAVPAGQVPPPSTVCFGGAVRATRPKRSRKAPPHKYAS